ncbi:putative uncharacterized protein DDB_G0286901 [Abrus precatorius]|uniref:Uncharacterized protein n=1 Tax=Abrus precatorius TaxID=3816 RepID=A0A8B8JK31_ABRPR|nr:putative uncharacterized protein DDB_G0286901 [Abrus precatorius]
MSSRLMRQILELMQAEEAAKGSINYGTSGSYNNHGTSNSFNNSAGGDQDFSNARINSGANSGDRTSYRHSNHYGGRTINNSGNFRGNGNAGFVEGGFNASTNNYY